MLLITVVFTVAVSSARAQDAATLGPRSFSAGAFFAGLFYAEPDDEISATVGGLGYLGRGRMLLGVQGGFFGAGTPDLSLYGLADVGYFLRARTNHQIYALGGLGGTILSPRSLLFNVGAGLDFLVFPHVGRPRQEGYVFGARAGAHLTASGGLDLAGVYVQLAVFGGGRRGR